MDASIESRRDVAGKWKVSCLVFLLLCAVFLLNFFRVLFLKSSLNAELSQYKLHKNHIV
jgi:hypothetical protein